MEVHHPFLSAFIAKFALELPGRMKRLRVTREGRYANETRLKKRILRVALERHPFNTPRHVTRRAPSRADIGSQFGNAVVRVAVAFGFARAFGNLVGDAAKASSSGGAEILPKTKKQRRVEAEARVEKRARSREKRKKLELRERGHVVPARGVVNPASDKLERRMLQTATRGVVRLFNAVSKAQKAVADAGKRKGGLLKPKELTKGSFLAELKKSGERERAEAKKEEKKEEEGGGGGWDVLSDGYLMGRNKLKDWDKGTRTAEEEVEYEDDDFD